jgi:uncharacterized membrane protein
MFAVLLYDVVKWVHITAVVAAFGPLFAYPVLLAVAQKVPVGERVSLHRMQIEISKKITGPVIGVIFLAGIYLASDRHLWSEFYVIAALVLLLVIAGLGITVLRSNEERLAELAEAGDEPGYARVLPTLRLWTLLTIALIVLAIFVMTAKPFA